MRSAIKFACISSSAHAKIPLPHEIPCVVGSKMKEQLESLIAQTLESLKQQGILPAEVEPRVQVTRTKDESHGDFASNIAMMLAKPCGKSPREVAQLFVDSLPENTDIVKTDIAGPGFINFFMNKASTSAIVSRILQEGKAFGRSQIGSGQKVLIEFVSANPTGPLHVGHGRGAAYGSVLSDLLEAAGFDVTREYYVNDAGRQMNILAASVWLRYLEACGENLPFPTNGYKGEYIHDIAAELKNDHGTKFLHAAAAVLDELPEDEVGGNESGDKERYIDAIIERSQALLGSVDFRTVFDAGLNSIVADIKQDLGEFQVNFQNWFSERSLVESGAIDHAVKTLKDNGTLYEKDGALWFKTTDYGDDKDRVVIRDNGVATYFASDIAYHHQKLERGFDRIIDIFGADHHGYEARVRASIKALGGDNDKFEIFFVQFANLFRGKEKISMSTRSGEFVTLRELRKEVGNDAARFFYAMRKCEQHMDFDLELAKSRSNDNPVYYVQYAHARICAVWRQLKESQLEHNTDNGTAQLALLVEPQEEALMKTISRYPEVLEKAAQNGEPHQLTYYARDLANDFHSYYNAHKFIIDDANTRDARLNLIKATQQVFVNVLGVLGLSAPEKM